jgi:hypothetical protein
MQRELKNTRVVGRRDLAESGVGNRRIRILELGVIGDVEGIATQLQIYVFTD